MKFESSFYKIFFKYQFNMKKIILVLLALMFYKANFAQIVLEQKYTSTKNFYTSTLHNTGNEFMWARWKFEGGDHVELILYHINHAIYKKIDLTKFKGVKHIIAAELANHQLFPISRHLVNDDDKLEFFIQGYNDDEQGYNTIMSEPHYLLVVNEDGEELQRLTISKGQMKAQLFDLGADKGTKLIITTATNAGHNDMSHELAIYALKGNLPPIAEYGAVNNIAQQNLLGNFFPNPAVASTKIYYELPADEKEGTFNVYNVMGILVKTMLVDEGFKTLELSVADLPSGNYFGQLICNNKLIGSKKLIVIH